jgi:hypothetical protein
MNYKELVQKIYPNASFFFQRGFSEYIILDKDLYVIGIWRNTEEKAWEATWNLISKKMLERLES